MKRLSELVISRNAWNVQALRENCLVSLYACNIYTIGYSLN